MLGIFGSVNKAISYKNYKEFIEETSDNDYSFISDVVLDIGD